MDTQPYTGPYRIFKTLRDNELVIAVISSSVRSARALLAEQKLNAPERLSKNRIFLLQHGDCASASGEYLVLYKKNSRTKKESLWVQSITLRSPNIFNFL